MTIRRFIMALLAAVIMAALTPFAAKSSTTEEDTSVLFSYCRGTEGLGGWAASDDMTWAGAMLFTQEQTLKYAGARLVAVQIATGSFTSQTEAPFEIFFTRDLYGEPFLTQDAEMDIPAPFLFKEYRLSTPVEIVEGDEFFVGYSIFTLKTDFDGENTSYNRGLVQEDSDLGFPGGYISCHYGNVTFPFYDGREWENNSATTQVAIKLRLEGKGLESCLVDIPYVRARSYVSPGEETSFDIKFVNTGTTEVTEIELSYGYEGEAHTRTIDLEPLKPNCSVTCPVSDKTDETGLDFVWNCSVTAINGIPVNEDISASHVIRSFPSEEGFAKNMVVELGTGQGCGWCPRALGEVQEMSDTHSDGSFIPIEIHCNYSDADPFYAPSYQPFWDYVHYTPEMMYGRELVYGLSTGDCSRIYDELKDVPSIARVENIRLSECDGRVSASAEVEFAFDEEDVDYRLAFVVTENNVVGKQSNCYTGWPGPVWGWENLPGLVMGYRHMNVARFISDYWGTEGSIPSSVRAGESYGFSADLDMSRVISQDECNIIALVINGRNNVIENAVTARMSEVSSLETIVDQPFAKEEDKVEFYDLNGHRIQNPTAPGVYIRRQGSEATKILVR